MWEKGNGIKYVKALETPGKKLFKDRLSTLDDERDFTLYSISLLWSSYLYLVSKSLSIGSVQPFSILCQLSFHFVAGALFCRFFLLNFTL